MSREQPALHIEGLAVTFAGAAGHVLRDVSFRIAPGEALGLIGESGSGKSTIAYAVMRDLPASSTVQGSIRLFGREIAGLDERALSSVRGRDMAMVYQDPMNALNPALRVGEQIAEVLRHHRRMARAAAMQRTVELLERVHLPVPTEMAVRYAHQLSGGQQQRVVIAMALACAPKLLILDEPTTGLDVTTEAVILDLINELRREERLAVLFISHNLGVVAKVCDRIGVLYAGDLVEEGPTAAVLERPSHGYTMSLLRALPQFGGGQRRLLAIPGTLPRRRDAVAGCIFHPRCFAAREICGTARPSLMPATGPHHRTACHLQEEIVDFPLAPSEILPEAGPGGTGGMPLAVSALRKTYRNRSLLARLRGRVPAPAVDDVSFEIAPGRVLGVVGESGSGKSTVARCIAGLAPSDGGRLALEGRALAPLVQQRDPAQRQAVQFVFQNPDSALNPRRKVEDIVARPLHLYGLARGSMARQRTIELLEAVKLTAAYLDRYPHELSGGEKQRVAIARAFAAAPRLVICDEPTSALDVSVQAAILNELLDLQRRHGTSYLFISHDLHVVRHMAHEILVMYRGRVVERGRPDAIFEAPSHDYTRRLLAALPRLDIAQAFEVVA